MPWNSDLQGPAFVDHRGVVELTINLHRRFQTGDVIVKKRPAQSARMRAPPERIAAAVIISSEGHCLIFENIKFGDMEPAVPFVGIFPNKKDFIHGIERVDLQLIITLTPVDEHFKVILQEY